MRGRHGDRVAPRLHELQHGGLAQHVLEDDAVGPQEEIALAGLQLLVLGIVEVAEQHLVRQRQRFAQAAADDLEVLRHRRVDLGRHFGRGFDRNHASSLGLMRNDKQLE